MSPVATAVVDLVSRSRRRRLRRTVAARSEPPWLSQRRKRKRSTGRKDEEDTVAAEHEAAASDSPPQEHLEEVTVVAEHQAAASASPPQEDEKDSSSAVSSPLRWPSLPHKPFREIDLATRDTYNRLKTDFFAKHDRHLKLVTLDDDVKPSCLSNSKLIRIRELATRTTLETAKVVFGLSSYIDGEFLRHSSGFLMDWDVDSKLGVVLTSAFLIQSKPPTCEEYAPHAKVHIHLLDKDDTTVVADLLHYDQHYKIAMFRIAIDLPPRIPSFTSEVKYAQEVFVLGRDTRRNLSIDHGNVLYEGPTSFEPNHYMFTTCEINKLVIGGPVIDFNGQFVGMIMDETIAFMPSSIILKCLEMWRRFNCIPRLHVGMKFSSIILLDPARIEKISRKCGVDTGLIVKRVSAGSIAEKLGFRHGDIIKSWNGKIISTTIELENFLLHMCNVHLDKNNSIGSNVDLTVGIFRIRKHSHGNIKLTVNVSNDIEVIAKGSYIVTPTHDDVVQGSSIVTPRHDDVVQGEEATQETAADELDDIDEHEHRRVVFYEVEEEYV